MELQGKKVLVVGMGISGIGAVEALHRVGAVPILFDENEKLRMEDVRAKLRQGVQAQIVIGSLDEEIKKDVDLVGLSPGVTTDTEFAEACRKRGVKIM